jgi:type I restriction enzyme S subunit
MSGLAKFKKYESYKQIEFKNVGDIPEHWESSTVGRLCFISRGRVISTEEIGENEGEYPVYSSQTLSDGVMGRINTYDFEGEYCTWTTDGANAGTAFFRKGKFNCTNVCGTLKNKDKRINIKFLSYYINTVSNYYVRPDINPKLMSNEMSSIVVVIPTTLEQLKIAVFLDRETAKLDGLISRKQRLIELLKEKRQALITHVVTKGLDPHAKMKDSGVEWIGEIPEGWEQQPLKHLIQHQVNGVWGKDPQGDINDIECIRIPDFNRNTLSLKDNEKTIRNILPKELKNKKLQIGDLLIEKSGGGENAPVGQVVIVNELPSIPTVCSNFISLIRIKTDFNSKFVNYLFAAMYFSKFTRQFVNQTTGIQNLNLPELLIQKVFIPTLTTQCEIASFLDNESNRIELLIDKLQTQITKIQEYRQALITEAVTGKIDVRGM